MGKKESRRFIQEMERVHSALMDWADWVVRHEHQSIIGFPVTASMAAGTQTNPGPLCPEVMMPPSIAATNQAVSTTPPLLQEVLLLKYMEPGQEMEKIIEYKKNHKCGTSTYYRRLDQGKAWVGAVTLMLKRGGNDK